MTAPLLTSPLVSTQWLADHLGSDDLVVLDSTVLSAKVPGSGPRWLTGHDEYLIGGHVPGAIFADILEVFSDPSGGFGFARPSTELFELAATSVGIDNTTTVVVYDGAAGQWAARIWWLFRSFGYDNVAVLDGGLIKWKREDRPIDTGHVEPRVVEAFRGAERPELWVDKQFVESVVSGETDAVLVCSLSRAEFSGEAGTRSRLGHIPRSVNVPSGRLIDRETNSFLHGDALADQIAPATASGNRIVTYCGGGIAAASGALALTAAGHTDVAIYDGSLNEWTADESAPLVITA